MEYSNAQELHSHSSPSSGTDRDSRHRSGRESVTRPSQTPPAREGPPGGRALLPHGATPPGLGIRCRFVHFRISGRTGQGLDLPSKAWSVMGCVPAHPARVPAALHR